MKTTFKFNNFQDTINVYELFILGLGYERVDYSTEDYSVEVTIDIQDFEHRIKYRQVLELMIDFKIIEAEEGEESNDSI